MLGKAVTARAGLDGMRRNGYRPRPPLALGIAALVVSTGPLHAQSVTECQINFASDQGLAVGLERNCFQQTLTKSGGAVEVCPTTSASVGYVGNAFRTEDGAQSDGFVRLSPALSVNTIGTQYKIGGNVAIVANRQFVRHENNFVDLFAKGNFEDDLSRDLRFRSLATFERGHEERSSIDVAGQTAALPKFIQATASAGLTYDPPPVFVSFGQRVRTRRFVSDPGDVAIGRNARSYRSTGCVGRKISKHFGALLLGEFTYTDRTASDELETVNDNYNVSILGQLQYQFTGVTDLSVGMGWLRSQTVGQRRDATSTFVARAKLVWRPTELTQVDVLVRNDIEQTRIGNTGYLLTRQADVTIQHDLHPRISLGLGGSFLTADVEGADASTDTLAGQINIGYAINEYAQIDLSYRHERRLARGDAGAFTNNSAILKVATRY